MSFPRCLRFVSCSREREIANRAAQPCFSDSGVIPGRPLRTSTCDFTKRPYFRCLTHCNKVVLAPDRLCLLSPALGLRSGVQNNIERTTFVLRLGNLRSAHADCRSMNSLVFCAHVPRPRMKPRNLAPHVAVFNPVSRHRSPAQQSSKRRISVSGQLPV